MPPVTLPPYRKVLRQAVENTDSELLRKALLDFIDKSRESDIPVLSNFIARVADVPPEPLRHCVRCHMDYTSVTNSRPGACTVPHVYNEATERIHSHGREGKELAYDAACCTDAPTLIQESEGEFNTENIEPCYEGQHTTNRYAVEYKRYSVVRCKKGIDGECTRTLRDDDPLFTHAVDSSGDSGESGFDLESEMGDSDEGSPSTSEMEEL